MGQRGPAPKSRDRKLLEGTFRKDRDSGPSIDPTRLVKVPKTPSWLSVAGKKEWRRITQELVELEVLTTLDLVALEGYCAAYARAIAAEEALHAAGSLTVLTLQGIIPRPEINIAKAAWAEARTFASRFGFTPADRPRVKAPATKPQLVSDPWEGVANG
jgi:P27 family predicted phage terminase small subunit